MQNNNFDIIIIGAGSGGLNVASFCGNVGLRTLLIDRAERHIGGDCLNYGCVPSKALIHMSHITHDAKEFASTHGGDRMKVDIDKVTGYVNYKIEHIRKTENSEYLKKTKKIEIELGEAKFVNKNTITLNGKLYIAKKFVLATGSRPRELSIPDDNSIKIYNNENIFNIDFLPGHFVFIGGGPINCELGQSFARLGSKVTILHSGARILEKEDQKASDAVSSQMTRDGVEIIYNVKTQEIKDGKIIFKVGDEVKMYASDAIFVGVGRQLNIENLDLEKAGVMLDESKRKLIVDKYLRTTNKKIFVVGDVAGNYMFTHAAEVHAGVVINNLFSPIKKKFEDKYMAWVTFTDPEVSTFGRQEAYLVKENIKYEVLEKTFEHDDRAIVDDHKDESVKIFIDKNGYVLGGTMICKNAGELSREYVLAMTQGIKIGKLFDSVYPYPIASRINRSLVGTYLSRKLTDRTKKLFRFLF